VSTDISIVEETPSEPVGTAMGRPTLYKPEFATQAAKLCKLGATDDELADFFGVSTRTILRWKAEKEDFCQAIQTAKDEADNRVERSLYQKAVGYEQDAVKIFMPAGASKPAYAPYREKVAPDTAAAIFWLKNRRKEQWRDRSEQEVTHKHTLSEEFEGFIRAMGRGHDVIALESNSNGSHEIAGEYLPSPHEESKTIP